ncbi:MAG: hypothetical protein AAF988_05760 [Pseudomonadota bacterium]
MYLRHYYRAATRDDIIDVCDQVADILRDFFSDPENANKKITIHVDGYANGGKSIFWDRVKDKLLSFRGIFVAKNSRSNDYHGRAYETWVGELEKNGLPLKIFFANISSLYKEDYDYEPLAQDANVVILTNTEHLPAHLKKSDLEITINSAEKSESTDGTWDRRLLLRSNQGSIFVIE